MLLKIFTPEGKMSWVSDVKTVKEAEQIVEGYADPEDKCYLCHMANFPVKFYIPKYDAKDKKYFAPNGRQYSRAEVRKLGLDKQHEPINGPEAEELSQIAQNYEPHL